jgi:hypothetical protein
MTMPKSDDDIGELSMWTAQENRAWRAPEMQARIAAFLARRSRR